MSTKALEIQSFGLGCWAVRDSRSMAGDRVAVILTDRGESTVELDSGHIQTTAEDVLVAPWSRVGRITLPPASRAIMLVLETSASDMALLGSGFTIRSSRGGTSGMLCHILRGLADDARSGFDSHSQRVLEQLANIVRVICLDRAYDEQGGMSALFTSATDAIEDRLWDDEIDADKVATLVNVSTRTLHRAFKAHDATISGWIRERRLDRCRADLADPRYSHVPVSQVAARWGLLDAAHFSRLFKARFGVPPRTFRYAGSQVAPSARRTAELVSA